LNKDSDNTQKVRDKGKKLITQQKLQTRKWQAREKPIGIGSSLAFEKPVAATEQPPEQQVSPMVSAPVNKHIAHSKACLAAATLEASRNNHGDKYVFSYHLALENVTDETICTTDVERPSTLEPALQVVIMLVPLTVQQQEGGFASSNM
jgi:hypothetical protein